MPLASVWNRVSASNTHSRTFIVSLTGIGAGSLYSPVLRAIVSSSSSSRSAFRLYLDTGSARSPVRISMRGISGRGSRNVSFAFDLASKAERARCFRRTKSSYSDPVIFFVRRRASGWR